MEQYQRGRCHKDVMPGICAWALERGVGWVGVGGDFSHGGKVVVVVQEALSIKLNLGAVC